jgi:hypothetical protein
MSVNHIQCNFVQEMAIEKGDGLGEAEGDVVKKRADGNQTAF